MPIRIEPQQLLASFIQPTAQGVTQPVIGRLQHLGQGTMQCGDTPGYHDAVLAQQPA